MTTRKNSASIFHDFCLLGVSCNSEITFKEFYPVPSSPLVVERSELLKIRSTTVYTCLQNFTTKNFWRVFSINSETLNETLVTFKNNPTVNQSELVIRSNTLFYGLYRISHTVLLEVDTGYVKNINNLFESSLDTYVQIVPTGIAVFGLENGNDYILIGNNQSLTVNPLVNSYDMDFLIKTSSLEFKFYCFIYDVEQPYPDNVNHFDLENSVDLMEYKTSKSDDITSCFNTSGWCF